MLHIVTDSMSDYIHAAHRDSRITVVSQPVRFGLTEFPDDGKAMPTEEFFRRMRTSEELPKTSMVPMQGWLDAFNDHLHSPDDEVLCIAGSSRLSGGYQSALLARKACTAPDRVTVIDSLTASAGEIMMIDEALRLADSGASRTEAAEAMESVKSRQHIVGLADDLKYLVMGGRLNPLIGKIGGALNIKPTLKLEGGVIEKAGVVRGVKKGYAWYVEQLKLFPPRPGSTLYLGGADCPEAVDAIRSLVEEAGIDVQIRCVSVGCVIGAHVGPGLTLVCWEENK